MLPVFLLEKRAIFVASNRDHIFRNSRCLYVYLFYMFIGFLNAQISALKAIGGNINCTKGNNYRTESNINCTKGNKFCTKGNINCNTCYLKAKCLFIGD